MYLSNFSPSACALLPIVGVEESVTFLLLWSFPQEATSLQKAVNTRLNRLFINVVQDERTDPMMGYETLGPLKHGIPLTITITINHSSESQRREFSSPLRQLLEFQRRSAERARSCWSAEKLWRLSARRVRARVLVCSNEHLLAQT